MTLEQARRLGSLAYQLHKNTRKLDSVQRRLLELLAELPARDSALAADALLTMEGQVAQAMLLLAVMRERLAATRATTAGQASDHDPNDPSHQEGDGN